MLASLVVSLLLPAAFPANPTFHFMQIEQVIGGVNGDTSAQAIQLRMRSGLQNFVSAARVMVYDAAGLNPIEVLNIPGNVPNGSLGDRVLLASSAFVSQTTPPAVPDFTIANVIPASYLAAGSLTFEDNAGFTIYWRLSWGGAAYTGSGSGSITNDNDGNFGPAFGGPLPSTGPGALQFQGPANAPSTNNAADYALTSGAATFTNNAGAGFTVNAPPPVVPALSPRGLLAMVILVFGTGVLFLIISKRH